MLDVIKAHAVNNLCYIASQQMIPKGIVVHSTGANNPNLNRYVNAPDEVGTNRYGNHWDVAMPEGRKVCVHAFVGYDKEKRIRVAELLPLDICCWGVGKGKKGSYNYNPAYIQFEICEDNLTNRAYYENVFAVAAEYCAELCRTYRINVDSIVGHCEAFRQGYGSNHGDPEHWMKNFDETMDDFRRRVSDYIYDNDAATKETEKATVKSETIKKGDLVSITENATYYNGKSIPSWVKAQKWFVKVDPDGDRVVIDENEKGTNSICSPIHRKFLIKELQTSLNVATKEKDKDDAELVSYLVKINADCLHIRKGSGTDTAIVGRITDHGVYTIVEEQEGAGASLWGKLKSGAGWISLDYVKKL